MLLLVVVVVVLLVLTGIVLVELFKLHSCKRFQFGHCPWRQVTDAIGNSPQEPDS